MNRKYHRQNIAAGLVVMAVGIAAFAFSIGMPGHAPVFPRIASTLLFVLGVILAVISGMELNKQEEMKRYPVELFSFVNPLYSLILMVAYVVCIDILGFYTATAAMQIGYMYHLGIKSVKTMAIVTTVVCLVVFFVFSIQLEVPLPKGILI